MKRILLLALIPSIVFVQLQLAAAAHLTSLLTGTVGSGKALMFSGPSGARVSRLGQGEFRMVIRDRSERRNFHLTGTGGFSKRTGITFTGTVTWRLTLARGPYRYFSDSAPKRFYSFSVR